jgi:hypothetical protein
MDDLARQRLKHNEAVFRSVNDEIDELGAPRSGTAFVCECADAACTATIWLSHGQYRRVRAEPGHFVVVPGHEVPEVETVVERAEDHLVVKKR